ncbi:thiamine pyrophosphokinase [Devosia pacifica]|uniref:Thiamine diphosphokinase n=2 Tax=Devosia pacifica TaxID=1335967 RepID=A0A918S858_9HYPH|nr:thiamine pyrophosphokinase [Devosia pacifica]
MVEHGDPPLVYERPIAIVGGGTVEPDMLRQLDQQGIALIGADGGGDVIADAGLVPAAIVGDFDSLRDPSAWSSQTRLVHLKEQMTSDFEKAVYSTSAPVTLALGMIGRRFDHTMAGLHVVHRYAKERRIILVDEVDIVMGVSGSFDFTAEPGERVSIHPLDPVCFRASSGLLFSLDGLALASGVRTGTSNSATQTTFSVETSEIGIWLLILGKARLADLIQHLVTRDRP